MWLKNGEEEDIKMKNLKYLSIILIIVVLVVLIGGCAGEEKPPDQVTVLLKWIHQAQFAGTPKRISKLL